MSDDEFNDHINALIGGLPITLVVNRLALLIRALVETGGEPAADCLRAVVQLRGAGEPDYSEYPPQALVERLREP